MEAGVKRHPTVKNGVLIGTGTAVLGDIEIGEYAKIGANSVVLDNIPAYVTAVGSPARAINKKAIRKYVAV
ncbi:serine O-acetyltransferase [Microaceticoccus formicicus]|uniref:serine O-acetyltransferase n=1 Tax=Microaceticoccus formicicus TaxID=3118105 RepID=UPI003CD01F73|nr:hypothetical protein VZL98_08640 [Peptoniphilaceae bacterium AMB_02]